MIHRRIAAPLLALSAVLLAAPAATAQDFNPYAGKGTATILRHVCRDARDADGQREIDRIEDHLRALRQAEIEELARLTEEAATQTAGGLIGSAAGFADRLATMIGGGGRTREELNDLLATQLESVGVPVSEIEAWILIENMQSAARRLNIAGGVIAETADCIAEARAALPGDATASVPDPEPTPAPARAAARVPAFTGFWRSTSSVFLEARGHDFYYQGTNELAFSLDCSTVGTVTTQGVELTGPLCTGTWYLGGMEGGEIRAVYDESNGLETLNGQRIREGSPATVGSWSAFKLSDRQAELEGLVPYGQ